MTRTRSSRLDFPTTGVREGFTLIELMIVMAVIIVLAGMAVPAFGSTMARSRLQSNASQMVQDLALVRDTAITYQQDLYMYVCTSPASDATVYYYELCQKDVVIKTHYTPEDSPVSGAFVRRELQYGMHFGAPVHGTLVTAFDPATYLVLVYCCGKDSYFRGQPGLVSDSLAPPYTTFAGSVGVPAVVIPIVDASSRTWYVTIGPAGRASSVGSAP